MSGIYEDLGLRPVLNAQGNRTLIGGSTPAASIQELMTEAGEDYVDMGELMDSVGERIADMLGVESALVTSGCAAALAVGAAACMTGNDTEKIERIPDVSGMPHEIIIQRQLRLRYDRCMTIPGAVLMEVGEVEGTRPEHLEAAIGPDTAAIHYLAPGDRTPGALSLEEVIRIGHSHDVPIIVDAASMVYPVEGLSKYVNMGADLVAYGAKYFGAVNSSGMLTGKKELVDIARMHSFIGFESSDVRSFGRPMKLDRQEVIAVYAALREWLTMNHEDRFAAYEVRIAAFREALKGISNIELADSPDDGPAIGLRVTIDGEKAGKTAAEVSKELRAGNPSIWVASGSAGHPDGYPPGEDSIIIRVPTLKEGGEQVIAQRLREILST